MSIDKLCVLAERKIKMKENQNQITIHERGFK